MTVVEADAAARLYFAERYMVVGQYPLVASRPILLQRDDPTHLRCRFCGKNETDVKFSEKTHAVSNLLGNKSLFSPNECAKCNRLLGQRYEDHLGKWSNLARAVGQVPGKKNKKPTFASDDLRIESTDLGLMIDVPSPSSLDELLINGIPKSIKLSGNTASQPHIPIRAAMALVKMACSVCPTEDVEQCDNAIGWLMERKTFRFAQFPVYFAFTPGPINDLASEVVILRRRGDGAEPFLWCVVQFRNFRFQVYVPGCPADEHLSKAGGTVQVALRHYPSRFGPNWPFGPTKFSWGDWSGIDLVRTTATVSHHIAQIISIDRPAK